MSSEAEGNSLRPSSRARGFAILRLSEAVTPWYDRNEAQGVAK